MKCKPSLDPLAVQEREKYETIWKSYPEYRQEGPADYLSDVFLAHFQEQIQPNDTVLDFGCGTGRSALPLLQRKLRPHLIDISENCLDPEIFLLHLKNKVQFTQGCLWDLPKEIGPAKWILCFDVLEHIPETKIEACLKAMSCRMEKGGLFSIFLAEDTFGSATLQKLHLTIRPASWWKEKLNRYFAIEAEFEPDEKTLVLGIVQKHAFEPLDPLFQRRMAREKAK